MNFRNFFYPLILCLLCVTGVRAQQVAEASDSVFFHYIDSLWTAGNRYYLVSNRLEVGQAVDQMNDAIFQRSRAGLLSSEQSDSLTQYVWKLMGSYNYLNSDYSEYSYEGAKRCYFRAMAYAVAHTDQQPSYFNQFVLHRELAQLYYKQKRYDDALAEMREAMDMAANYYSPNDDDYLDVLSQYALCLARQGHFDTAQQTIQDVIDQYVRTDTERYGEALRKKAKILMIIQEKTGMPAAEALGLYKKYYDMKRRDALQRFKGMSSAEREQYWMTIRPFIADCYRLENVDAAFLYDVTLFSKGLLLQLNRDGGGSQALDVSWRQVQAALPADGCAIEFVQYEKKDEPCMGALVLRKTGLPRFVPMPSPETVYEWILDNLPVRERLFSREMHMKDCLYDEASGLFQLIWSDALLHAIGTSKQVYFAPDGYLQLLAIEYMLPHDAPQLTLHRLTSTRRLLDKRRAVRTDRALIVGGIDYVWSEAEPEKGNDVRAYQLVHDGMYQFKYLFEAAEETTAIYALRDCPNDSLLQDEHASETAFRRLCGRYPIVHIASHGMFNAADIPQGTDLMPCLTDESLSESQIALAGIQTAIEEDTFDPQFQDGILSAKEIASFNMSNVDLVVLACCESGLGHITSEGVYGMLRGLKNAGAGAVVLALWDVSDLATKWLMISLHENLRKGMTVTEAFRQARASFETMELPSEEGLRFNSATLSVTTEGNGNTLINRPRYRDAFILIDAID